MYIYIERLCALITDKLIAVANEDIKKGLRYKIAKEKKFILIRAGIDNSFYESFVPNPEFRNTIRKDKSVKIILTIGPFKPQKNIADFIKAAAEVSKTRKDILFAIVGDGEQRQDLQNLAQTLNIKDKILFLGWRNDIKQILYSIDIFVLTSLWEGLPCTIIEAMACQKPVIANAVDGVKEIVIDGENGFLIKPYDYKGTAEKILYTLENESRLSDMGKKAVESVKEEFNMDFVVRQHESLYSDLNQREKK
jgi:glycosyltransferase involved in cell wall biosynthesis